MIFGSISFCPGGDIFTTSEKIRKVTDYGDLIFHPVVNESFSGGYYLHSGLPCKPRDFYYSDERRGLMVLLSGYVYNSQELYPLLGSKASVSDPELIAGLYLREGPGFVKKLNGDFAIFISERKRKIAFLYRDHLGIRPMAWTKDIKALNFSSDIIGLCRACSDGEVVDREYMMGYFKYIDYRKTPSRKVTKLLPGNYLEYSDRVFKIREYWKPKTIRVDNRLQYKLMLSELSSILHDAVRIRCDQRFNAGAHVSSGIDSGVISTLARKEYKFQADFYGFSWSPGDINIKGVESDERELVTKSAENANISLLFSDISVTDFPVIVSQYYDNQGYFFEERVIRKAAEMKINLIFSGWGGDEFISTGERGINLDLLRGLHLKTFFRRNPIKDLRKFVKKQLFYVVYPAFGILDKKIAKSFRDDALYIKKAFKRSDRKAMKNFYFHVSRHQLHLRMLQFYHLQERCESWMINGYRKGVEYRYPLLDRRIIEYMLKVPTLLLCKTDHFRPLLREMSEGILSEGVRWNWSKNDPVWFAYMNSLFRESSVLFMEEADTWKSNPDLSFIDFELLKEDICKHKSHSEEVNEEVLFRALVYIKAIHDFSVKYHEL
jgi:asparagine synthase (glutamine-hydrolysing)